jgi:hypothetical protein
MDSARAAIQLLIIMVEGLKGRIDTIFPQIVIFAVSELSKTNSKSYRVSLVELVNINNLGFFLFHL